MAGLVRPDSKAELTPTEVAVNPVIYRPEILGHIDLIDVERKLIEARLGTRVNPSTFTSDFPFFLICDSLIPVNFVLSRTRMALDMASFARIPSIPSRVPCDKVCKMFELRGLIIRSPFQTNLQPRAWLGDVVETGQANPKLFCSYG
ncbi:hypothetical protein RRG08_011064 [Elysia crispata]|uniref:Uncharacterized protein n=1 Tax=Elysia crispata TaxID=231223 RepID=A0AAE0Z8Y2_9GAST|nr:hypothetical protein RRG08_011064 [Elysia crispata]